MTDNELLCRELWSGAIIGVGTGVGAGSVSGQARQVLRIICLAKCKVIIFAKSYRAQKAKRRSKRVAIGIGQKADPGRLRIRRVAGLRTNPHTHIEQSERVCVSWDSCQVESFGNLPARSGGRAAQIDSNALYENLCFKAGDLKALSFRPLQFMLKPNKVNARSSVCLPASLPPRNFLGHKVLNSPQKLLSRLSLVT